MMKLILALFLLAGKIRIAEPWTRCFDDQTLFFASEESNKSGSDIKEKLEQEQAFPESGSLVVSHPGQLIIHPIDLHQFIPTHHDEPSCPPPDTIHS